MSAEDQNSSNPNEEITPSPQKKIKVANDDAAVLPGEAASTLTEDTTVPPPPPDIDPQLLEYLNANFTSLQKDNDALKKDNDALKKDYDVLKKDHDVLKKDHDVLKKDYDALESRVDSIAEALDPATVYALFETAVFTFVDIEIDQNPHLQPDRDLICHSVVLVCRKLLCYFMSRSDEGLVFSWQNPRGNRLPKATIRSLVQCGLYGTSAFIRSQTDYSFLLFDPKERNSLLHNGKFLHAIYYSPPSTPLRLTRAAGEETVAEVERRTFSEKKKSVKNAHHSFAQQALSVVISEPLEDAVSFVVEAFKEKGEEITDVYTTAVTSLKKMLD